MKHYLYRILKTEAKEMTDLSKLAIDYTPLDMTDEDKIIVFVSEELNILGEYRYKHEHLLISKSPKKMLNLREFIGKLSFVNKEGPRAYKTFAKKTREITVDDYEKIMKEF